MRFFALILICLSGPVIADPSGQIAKFDVANMTCATCPIAVKKAMERVEGVNDVSVDLQTAVAIVEFDPSKTDVKEIARASTDVGFSASLIQAYE